MHINSAQVRVVSHLPLPLIVALSLIPTPLTPIATLTLMLGPNTASTGFATGEF